MTERIPTTVAAVPHAPGNGPDKRRPVEQASDLTRENTAMAAVRPKTYRLPVELLDRIEAFRSAREAAAREHLPPELHNTVKVQEIDVVKMLLLRGLEALEQEEQTPRKTKKRT